MTPPHSFEGVHCAMTQEQPLQIGEGSTVPQQKCLKPFYQEQSWERAIIPCASGAGNGLVQGIIFMYPDPNEKTKLHETY